MNIFVVSSNNYPSPLEHQKGTFIYKLVQQFISLGNPVKIFAPEKRFKKTKLTNGEYGVEKGVVFRPKVFSFSNIRILGFNTFHLGRLAQIMALRKLASSHQLDDIDVIYAHFLSNAINAVSALSRLNKPIFVAVGENRGIDIIKGYFRPQTFYRFLEQIDGFIAVSPLIQEKLLKLGVPAHKTLIVPNGVDTNVFRPVEDKSKLRKELGLEQDIKIVLFVGRFVHDKGPLRVLEALESLGENVKGLFLGTGPQILQGEKILFQGAVSNSKVAKYMAAADLFVLPTLHEGSSNVIVEAMACGLPIISSDIPEVRVQCDGEFSILVNPLNIFELSSAIKSIIFDERKMSEMREASVRHAKNFRLSNRADKILKFIENQISLKCE